MRAVLGALATACVLSACGGSSPSAPEVPPVAVPTGAQVLRLSYQGQCSLDRRSFFPMVLSRVTVTRSGSEWIARATTPDSGDVELRFHQSGPSLVAGSMPVQGTITGLAIHSPELSIGLPSAVRATFSNPGSALSGFAFSPSSLTPVAGSSGIGNGSVTFSDNDGQQCTGSTFSWSVFPAG